MNQVVYGDNPMTREEIVELLKRLEFEHQMLVNRTAAILALNGLLGAAVGVGTNLPSPLKLLLAIVMIAMNVLWIFRAASNGRLIDALTEMAYRDEWKDLLPVHARIHKEHIAPRLARKDWLRYYSSQVFFSIGIPFGLLLCWVFGILLWPFWR